MERPLKIAPETQPTGRLGGVTPMEIENPEAPDLNGGALKAEIQAEMEKAWESDWSMLGPELD